MTALSASHAPVPAPANAICDATARPAQCPTCRTYQWAAIGPGALEGDYTLTCLICGPVRWRVEVRNLPDVELPARHQVPAHV